MRIRIETREETPKLVFDGNPDMLTDAHGQTIDSVHSWAAKRSYNVTMCPGVAWDYDECEWKKLEDFGLSAV